MLAPRLSDYHTRKHKKILVISKNIFCFFPQKTLTDYTASLNKTAMIKKKGQKCKPFGSFLFLIKKDPQPFLNSAKVGLITDFFLSRANYSINWELIQFSRAYFVQLECPSLLEMLLHFRIIFSTFPSSPLFPHCLANFPHR